MRPKVHMGSQKLGDNKTDGLQQTEGEGKTKKGHKMKIACLNIRSMREHYNEFIAETEDEREGTAIISIVEANIHEEERQLYNIPGYDQIGRLRETQKGGGIITYIRKDVTWEEVPSKTRESFEHVVIKITTQKEGKITIITIYKPRHHPKYVEEFGHLLSEQQGKLIIMGDVNIDFSKTSAYITNYRDLLAMNNLTIRIDQYTRVAARKGKITRSKIDHIYTKNVEGDGYVVKINVSDHYMVGIEIEGRTAAQKDTEITFIDNAIVEKLINKESWNETIDDVDLYYNELTKKLEKIYKQAERKKKSKPGKILKLPRSIRKQINEKNEAYHRWRKEKDKEEQEKKKQECKKLQNQVKITIRKYTNRIAAQKLNEAKNDITKMWQTTNELLGKEKRKDIDQVVLRYMGEKKTSEEIAEEFKETFRKQVEDLNLGCDIRIKKTDEATARIHYPMEKIDEITEEEVQKILKRNETEGTRHR